MRENSFKDRQYSLLFKKQYLLTPRRTTLATQETSSSQTKNCLNITSRISNRLKSRDIHKKQWQFSHFKTLQSSPKKLQPDSSFDNKNDLNTSQEGGFRQQNIKKISVLQFKQKKLTNQSLNSCPSTKKRTINQRYSNLVIQKKLKSKQNAIIQFFRSKRSQIKFQAMSRIPIFQTKKARRSILTQFSSGLEAFFQKTHAIDLEQALKQLGRLKNQFSQILVQKKPNFQAQTIKSIGKQCTNNFSKLCYYLAIYLIVQKYNLKWCILSISKDIEYFARRIQFFGVVLNICFKIGQYQSLNNDFANAKYYFTKSLNLAVFLNDKYSEQLAIDKLGMCEYYIGNISEADHLHKNQNKLPIFEYQLIKEQYSNQNQISKLFNQKHQNGKTCFLSQTPPTPRQINFQTKSIQNYPLHNRFQALKEIQNMAHSRQYQSDAKLIKLAMNKTMQIGKKKFFGKIFTPKASKYRIENEFENQIILTHRSFNRIQNDHQQKFILRQARYFSQLLQWLVQDCLPVVLNEKQSYQDFIA